jgi:hypothetical protein
MPFILTKNRDTVSTKNPLLLPSHDVSFVPLRSAPDEVKEIVWGSAIYFAMLQEEDYILKHQYFDENYVVNLDVRGHHILQVSKMFHASPSLLRRILDSKL